MQKPICQCRYDQNGDDVKIIKSPKIPQALAKGAGSRTFFFLKQDIVLKAENLFFSEANVHAADLVSVQNLILDVLFYHLLFDLEKVLHLIEGQHVVHNVSVAF
jgi:hypothetical protein